MNVTTSVDIVLDGDATGFHWILRAEKPVRHLFRSCSAFPTRVAAMKDFQDTCELLDWKIDAEVEA